MHGDVFGDLLKVAGTIYKKIAADFNVGDEVEVRLPGGVSYGGTIEEMFPDATANVPLRDRPKKVPLSALTSLAVVETKKEERRQRDEEEARQRAEEERLAAEEAATLSAEEAGNRRLERAKQKIETADAYYNVEQSALDNWAGWLAAYAGTTRPVRVHYGEKGAVIADWLFQQVGVANTLQPYTPGTRGGITEMFGVQGIVRFPTPPNFKESDVPVAPDVVVKNDGKTVVINDTAFAFQLIERGFVPHT